MSDKAEAIIVARMRAYEQREKSTAGKPVTVHR